MIIFYQFTRRRVPGRGGRATPILLPYYIQNIAKYVEDGGALLIATGPGFASENSLYRSALAAVLPARPTGEISEYAFKPELTDKGRRHPVTASFADRDDQSWGEWFRIIDSDVISGHVLMEGPGKEPLLIMEKVKDGRVGMLMSDQSWLWARGHNGGGPYSELFRRLAHWLLGEPDLDAERLTAQVNGDELIIERQTLGDADQKVVVQKPDGTAETITLKKEGDGYYRGIGKTSGQGAYILRAGDISTITAIGSLNPKEYSDLAPTTEKLKPLADVTGGAVLSTDKVPQIRRIKAKSKTVGDDWIGLINNEQYVTQNSRRAPLAPGLIFFILAMTMLAFAWRREG